jgi:hypothetical protein
LALGGSFGFAGGKAFGTFPRMSKSGAPKKTGARGFEGGAAPFWGLSCAAIGGDVPGITSVIRRITIDLKIFITCSSTYSEISEATRLCRFVVVLAGVAVLVVNNLEITFRLPFLSSC